MAERPIRGCDICGEADDHPRHVIGRADQGGTVRHMDCCAAAGCGVCAETELENEGRRGQDLIDHLTKGH